MAGDRSSPEAAGEATITSPAAAAAAAASEKEGQFAQELGPAERALVSAKSFAHIAWEELSKPLTTETGSPEVRWEICSTWTLLLFVYHAEVEAEVCRRTWKPQPWRTEAQALRHIFLCNRSVRALSAVLRWLRWGHRCAAPEQSQEEANAEEAAAAGGAYQRTLRQMRLQRTLNIPLGQEAPPALHPDGPLLQRSQFDRADLEDEGKLLRRLWVLLREGDLHAALKLCASSGQAWRTALLQGMLPYADEADGTELSYSSATMEDDDANMILQVKEEHTDWTETGTLEKPGASNGNPWRRIWKEECWDVAQRNLGSGATTGNSTAGNSNGGVMSQLELAIYGLCAGHQGAMKPLCGGSWADACWAELHCLKEWLVERLLDDGREKWCAGPEACLGEGDCTCLPGEEGEGGSAEDAALELEERRVRSQKLWGKLAGVPANELDARVARCVDAIMARAPTFGSAAVAPDRQAQAQSSPFVRLQSILVKAAFADFGGHSREALALMRSWLEEGLLGAPCPFVVKQFASHFAIWQRDVSMSELVAGVEDAGEDSDEAMKVDAEGEGTGADQATSAVPRSTAMAARPAAAAAPRRGASGRAPLGSSLDVDKIVNALVQDMVAAATQSWVAQCLDGRAAELISEHAGAMSSETRLGAYAAFMLELGERSARSGAAAAAATVTRRAGVTVPGQAVAPEAAAVMEEELPSEGSAPENALRFEVLMRCFTVFWESFPHEALQLLTVIVRRALRLAVLEEDVVGDAFTGVRAGVEPQTARAALLCLVSSWVVLRDKAEDSEDLQEVFEGMAFLLGGGEGLKMPAPGVEFAAFALDHVVLPLFADAFLCLSVLDEAMAADLLPTLKESTLWRDAMSREANCAAQLMEVKWYLELHNKHRSWNTAFDNVLAARAAAAAAPPQQRWAAVPGDMPLPPQVAEAMRLCSSAQDDLFDWARVRMANSDALLEVSPDTLTALTDVQWQALRRSLASRVMLLMLSVFERARDFDGGMFDLAVAVAQSPWLLRLIRPCDARAFLYRLALIPTCPPEA